MADVTVWRQDTPNGETFDDAYAQTQTKADGTKYKDAVEFANDLIANAGYSATPQPLAASFGGGTPEPTGNEIEATDTPNYFNIYTNLLNKTEDILKRLNYIYETIISIGL